MTDAAGATPRAGGTPASCACGARATDAELQARLDEVLQDYRGRPGALIPVLQIAQGIYGYLPEHVLKHVALALGKSYSEVAGVVGFYSFFSRVPRGKHLVRVCLGTACYVRGGKQVLEAFTKELGIEVGGTTPDGLFSLEVARCFGACGLAPTIMVDEDVHQRVKPLKLRAILDTYQDGAPGTAKPAATLRRKTAVGKRALAPKHRAAGRQVAAGKKAAARTKVAARRKAVAR
jgi:NADH:ubiquinone oxidoreductase subunit E